MTDRGGGPYDRQQADAALVKESFAHIELVSDKAMAYFYGRLFTANPELRALFPLAMDRQRDRFSRALAKIVWSLDCPEELNAFLQQLGRDHRRYGVNSRHYQETTSALLVTIREFLGSGWTSEIAAAWESMLAMVTKIMTEAATADARVAPSWWLAEVVDHQRRAADLAVLTLQPDQPLSYLPGQYLSVQSARWPRQWRNYSVASAPRDDGRLELHVRAIPGGMVSTALVHHTLAGETLLIGPARGTMTIPPGSSRDLFCIAGGTGLAPIKAIIEQVLDHEQVMGIEQQSAAGTVPPRSTEGPAADGQAAEGPAGAGQDADGRAADGRAVTLLFGARDEAGLYDLEDLGRLAARSPSFKIITAVSDEPDFGGIHGSLPEVTAQYASELAEREVYVCGPPAMVRRTQAVLAGLGTPAERLHFDEPDVAPGPDD